MQNKKKEETFQLHIGPATEPGKKTGEKAKKPLVEKFHKKTLGDDTIAEKKEPGKKSDKLWNFLRFGSTAAIIFIVLFFAMNWNAYSAIIMNKFGFLKPAGEYIEGFEELYLDPTSKVPVKPGEQPEQDMMELSKDPEVQKTQIPDLSLDITPPDTRIIIPRINKNVPIVTISTEALVSRDWTRLEQEIQDALQDGVVHYPGTAFPGDTGNIVVTGHSSYFPWDPGRFKDVFALLHDVHIGDKIFVYYKQNKYVYEVYDTKVVLPTVRFNIIDGNTCWN